MFDEYADCQRFDTVDDLIPLITDVVGVATEDAIDAHCVALRDEVLEKHSYPAFREQLARVVTEVVFDAA